MAISFKSQATPPDTRMVARIEIHLLVVTIILPFPRRVLSHAPPGAPCAYYCSEACEDTANELLRTDVLFKLRQTSARERWVFVPVALGGAPFAVESYLTGDLECLPQAGPGLPSPVTGVWVTSTFGKSGVRWDGAEWHLFEVKVEPDTP